MRARVNVGLCESQVTGEQIEVLLSNAFIGSLYVKNVYGDVRLQALRTLTTDVTTVNGDVIIEVRFRHTHTHAHTCTHTHTHIHTHTHTHTHTQIGQAMTCVLPLCANHRVSRSMMQLTFSQGRVRSALRP